MRTMWVAMICVLAISRLGLCGQLGWANPSPLTEGSFGGHVTVANTIVQLYKDNGDSVFTWGGEGSAVQTSPMANFGGLFFGDTYNYGVAQLAQKFWAVYYDQAGGGYYSVSSDGFFSVANDPDGNGSATWDVAAPTGSFTAVPEPSTFGLVALGIGLMARRRMKKS